MNDLYEKYKDIIENSCEWHEIDFDNPDYPEPDILVICLFKCGSIQPTYKYGYGKYKKNNKFVGETDWVTVIKWHKI